jgi:hypothetical protein
MSSHPRSAVCLHSVIPVLSRCRNSWCFDTTDNEEPLWEVHAQTTVPGYKHIFVIMEENHSYEEIIGNPNDPAAPNLYRLADTYGLATNYSGVTHPSEPNYVALIGGSNFQVTNDDPYTPTNTVDAPSLASQLDAAGLSWKAYEQSLPYAGFTGFYYPSKNQDAFGLSCLQHTCDTTNVPPMAPLFATT